MTKTKYWLSLLAVSVVLIAGSLAFSPIAIAGDDDDDDDDIEEFENDVEVELSNATPTDDEDEDVAHIIKKGEMVLATGEFKALKVVCGASDVFLTNSVIVNTFPAKPEAQFSGGGTPVNTILGNLDPGSETRVGARVALTNEHPTNELIVEMSIVCARP